MAVERLDLNGATARSGPRSWLASVLGLRWRVSGRVAEAPVAPHVVLTERSEATRLEDLPVRLSMHGVLSAWREADRALRTFDEGSPEWAAVNATRLALRASYLARFDEYQADDASS